MINKRLNKGINPTDLFTIIDLEEGKESVVNENISRENKRLGSPQSDKQENKLLNSHTPLLAYLSIFERERVVNDNVQEDDNKNILTLSDGNMQWLHEAKKQHQEKSF